MSLVVPMRRSGAAEYAWCVLLRWLHIHILILTLGLNVVVSNSNQTALPGNFTILGNGASLELFFSSRFQ